MIFGLQVWAAPSRYRCEFRNSNIDGCFHRDGAHRTLSSGPDDHIASVDPGYVQHDPVLVAIIDHARGLRRPCACTPIPNAPMLRHNASRRLISARSWSVQSLPGDGANPAIRPKLRLEIAGSNQRLRRPTWVGGSHIFARHALHKPSRYATIGRHGGKPMTILRFTRRDFFAALDSAAAFPMIVGLMLLASSFGPSHAEAHDIYTTLKDSHGASCCNGGDCRPAQYRTTTAGIEMRVGGHWIFIPDSKVQYRTLEGDTGETAGGHWCGVLDFGVTYCAILPPTLLLLG